MRFIPTGVGNTLSHLSSGCSHTVHPHGCGEHSSCWERGCNGLGSSPRVWGTPQVKRANAGMIRFIPTGVGNTFSISSIRSNSRGSSPRVWGTRAKGRWSRDRRRFIPTGVGNTSECVVLVLCPSVHPHGCGEHRKRGRRRGGAVGSSPRVWGTPPAGRLPAMTRRFIPTGVGNTLARISSRMAGTVHPHGCGEHGCRIESKDVQRGSSPRVWGTLL